MLEACLRLMGKKLLVAVAMEGKFASEGLQAIDGDNDMLTAMARELVENKRIGDSADSVWKNLQQLRPATTMTALEAPEEPMILEISIPETTIGAGTNGETIILPCESPSERNESAQLSLF
jgi:hypothetical protein